MALPSDRWPEVKQILAMVVNIPGLERREFLKNACGSDAELCGEVESLLACHELAEEAGVLARLNSLGVSPRKALDAWAAALEPTVSFKRHDGETTTIAPSSIYQGKAAALEDFGDYELIGELGRGGMGVVYKARQKSLNRLVALKMISSRGFSREEAERFRIEAQAAGKLDHPGIAPVYEVGEHDGRHYYSMAFINGPSLSSYLRGRDKKLTYQEAAGFIEKIADAMQYAHDKGVIHRDLKPGNIMLDEQGTVKIVDFGLARELESDSNLTQDGQFLGTPSYAPPEQGLRANQVGPAADVYAIGAILYTLLTDLPPFRADNVAETILLVRNTEPVAPQIIDRKLPKDLQTICLKCLEKDPAKRYASARDLANEARRFLNGEPIAARPISRVERAWRWSRRKPALASLLAVVAVAIVAIIAVLAVDGRRLRDINAKEQASFVQSLQVIDDMLTKVSEDTLLDQPGLQPMRRDLLDKALTYYRQLLEQRGDDPLLKEELAKSQFRVAFLVRELDTLIEAYQELQRAEQMQLALVDAAPDDHTRRELLSDIQTQLGDLLVAMDDFAGAEAALKKALSNRKRLVDADPANRDWQRKLGNAEMNLAIWAKNVLLSGHVSSADDAKQLIKRALERMEVAQAVRLKLLDTDSGDVEVRRDLGKGYFELASLLRLRNPLDPAIGENGQRTSAAFEQALEQDPSHLDTLYFLGMSYAARAAYFKAQYQTSQTFEGENPWDASIRLYTQASAVLAELVAKNPAVVKYAGELSRTEFGFADLIFEDESRDKETRRRLDRSLELLRPILPNNESEYLADYINAALLLSEVSEDSRSLLIDARNQLDPYVEQLNRENAKRNTIEPLQNLLDKVNAVLSGAAAIAESSE